MGRLFAYSVIFIHIASFAAVFINEAASTTTAFTFEVYYHD